MPSLGFTVPEDIANRALQHCGTKRIANFGEDSKQATETFFVYDKLRRAELRRNVWRFATRRTPLRPINFPAASVSAAGLASQVGPIPNVTTPLPTLFVRASLWSASTTYLPGALVTDQNGVYWQCWTNDNIGNYPGSASDNGWELYFGPLTAAPFDTTQQIGYFTGELVYEAPGDGTYKVYMSLVDGNKQDPSVAAQWQSAAIYTKDQIVQFYPNWAIGTTYAAGNGVNVSGVAYISIVSGNVGNAPASSPSQWQALYTTLGPALYSSTTTYTIGQFVLSAGAVYMSLVNSNTGNTPASSPSQWIAVQVGTTYVSLIDLNFGNEPDLSPINWNSLTTYAANNTVTGSDGFTYTSKAGSNTGNDPVLTNGVFWTKGGLTAWVTNLTGSTGSDMWVQVPLVLSDLNFTYPLGTGPVFQSQTRNVYRLPAGFLRQCPQDPKDAVNPFLGAPTGHAQEDWLFEGDYLITRTSTPIIFRFVADVADVNEMDDMFCEGLACTIALAVCEPLTQSTTKLQQITAEYKRIMGEARIVNGIETGTVEPPEDDYVIARL